jgi:eukaryotic-like serine/threonine-protein kinase
LTPERWVQIEALFHRAVECDPEQRAAMLDVVCRHDPELRREVEALLVWDRGGASAVQATVRAELHNLAFPLTGKTVSHYRILEGLSGGGMGTVYCAQDVKLSRRIAVKFLPEESAADPAALRRFEREALSASALEHPNICPIYEFGEHEGRPFIVMPLLQGQTVAQWIATAHSSKTPLPMRELLDLATQVLRGLEAAHAQGIIHRDIKPANIFFTNDGQAKILDFGVAKLTRGDPSDADYPSLSKEETATAAVKSDATLSRTGTISGTAAYMSPEQVRCEKVDARTDLFSFGLVLYEMAVGKRAFGGSTWPVLQEEVLSGTTKPVRGLNPDIPIRLENIITKAIEKDREARYQTAAEMRADLEALQRQLTPKHLPRAWAAALAIGATLFVAITVVLLKRQPQTISVAPEIKLRQLTSNSSENPVIGGAISPDGKCLAYSDTKGLHIKLIDAGETRSVPQPEALKDQSVKWEVGSWFPDSTRFLVNIHPSTEDWNEWSSVNTSIWAVSVLGGAPAKLRDHAVLYSVSPDGSLVSFGTNKGKLGEREIWLMGPNGEQARKFQETSEDTSISAMGWSPDGKRYAYIFTDASGDRMLSRDTGGGSPVPLFQDELKKMNDIVWLHDGRVVYDLTESENGNVCNYWTMRLDLATGKRLEEPRRLTNWPSFCVSSGSVTNDDKRITFARFSSFFTSYVAELEAGGTRIRNPRHFTLEDSDDYIADWTADSKAVIVGQHRGDSWGLYKQSLDSETPEPIVPLVLAGWPSYAVMSPDGKWAIALIWPVARGVTAERPSTLPIVRIPIAGGAPETILQLSRPAPLSCARPPSNMCVIAEVSDDHKRMVVSVLDPIKGRGPELARFDLDREVDVFRENLICDLSPDGTRLAITRSPESPIEIYSTRGQLAHIIASRPLGKLLGIRWSANGNGFFATRRAQGGTELLHIDLKGTTQSLYKCTGWGCFASPSPDGRHLAILDNKQSMNMWMMENF